MKRIIRYYLAFTIFLGSCSPEPVNVIPTLQKANTPVPTSTPSSIPCFLLHEATTPEAALNAECADHGHIIGKENAAVTIIVFSDYQCVACALLASNLREIRMNHPDDVRMILLHAPQKNHDKDDLAIQAVEAADMQGKFWEMNDLLYEKLDEWSAMKPEEFVPWAGNQAESLGIDVVRFNSDIMGQQVAERLQQAVEFGTGIQTFSTPILFINSTSPYTGLIDLASLDTVVRLDALIERQFSTCPPEIISPQKQYIVTLHLVKGNVVFQLFPEKAPQAVNNFVFLVKSGWYDGITFYRVLTDEEVMSGDPSETGLGNPGYLFNTEIVPDLHFDQPGLLAMDNDGPGTNGSRFFITLAPAPQMEGLYTIFGQVLSGLEIISTLAARDPKPGLYLAPGDEIISVSIEEH